VERSDGTSREGRRKSVAVMGEFVAYLCEGGERLCKLVAPLRALAHGLGVQVHLLGGRAQGLYARAAVLYEPAAAVSGLPQDRRSLAEVLSKPSPARFARAEALFDESPVRCDLAEVTCEDTRDRSEAVERLGKTHA
jgi:hypothetical protein